MPTPAGPPPRPPRTTRNLVIAVSVLVVLLLLVSTGLVLVVRHDVTELADPTTPTTAPAPSTPPSSTPGPSSTPSPTPPVTVNPLPTGPPPTPEELEAEVAELSAFVEGERGLPFLEPVAVTMADEDLFAERLFDGFEEDAVSLEETERVLEALGLMDADVDLVDAMRQLLGAGVLGFYDPETDELVVRGQAITPFTRATIVHELTHALDDQHFDLDRPEYDDTDDEIGFGFSAVVEGNARRVENAWTDALSPADRSQLDTEEQQFSDATAPLLDGLPLILLKLLQAPYDLGPSFVLDLLDVGGQPMLDEAIVAPPTTTAQVLHPELFLQGIGAVPVDPPAADGEVLDEGMFGELLTQYTLEDSEDPSVAVNAASGWAGDAYVTWQDGPDSVCIRIAYEMRSSGDLDELEDAYTSWAAPRGATVERNGSQLEVTSCSAAAGGTSPL